MSISSPLRSRRFAARQTEARQQLISFRLREEWFALPVDAAQKVIPLGHVYGDPAGTGVSLTVYQGEELLVIDVARRIFKETPHRAEGQGSTGEAKTQDSLASIAQQRFLLIVQSSTEELVGLPIDSQPSVIRVPGSSFKPLPAAYVAQGGVQCVSSMMIELTQEQPPLFLLDPDQLAQPLDQRTGEAGEVGGDD